MDCEQGGSVFLGLSGLQSPVLSAQPSPPLNQEPEINTKKIWLKNVAFQGVFRDLLQVRLGGWSVDQVAYGVGGA